MASFKMGKMVIRSLFGKPATLMYPVKPAKITEATRGHITINVDTCIFCGICQKKCPTNAITVDRKGRVWSIERMKCIQCNSCAVNCPKDSLLMETTYTAPSAVKITDTFQGPPKEEKAPAAAAAEA